MIPSRFASQSKQLLDFGAQRGLVGREPLREDGTLPARQLQRLGEERIDPRATVRRHV